VRRRLWWALIAVACAGVAACGHTATKQDVVAQANAICSNALRAVRDLPPPAGATTAGPAVAAYLAKVVAIVNKEAASTRALPRPAQDRAVLNRYVAAVSASARQYEVLAAAAKNSDAVGVSRALASLRASPVPGLAVQYGLTRCSASASTAVS
jgi:hypothetical protein